MSDTVKPALSHSLIDVINFQAIGSEHKAHHLNKDHQQNTEATEAEEL